MPDQVDIGITDTLDHSEKNDRLDFYARARQQNLAPLWRVLHAQVTETPNPVAIPAVWEYAKVRPYLIETCSLISMEEAERRVLILENPALIGQSRITQSLYCGVQIILPGEVAPSHRHVASALRFIVEGKDSYTAIAGEKTTMEPGDFVITPSWAWHDHANESDAPMVWIDGLDLHIVNLLGASFKENYAQSIHPQTQPEGSAFAQVGNNMLPIDFDHGSQTSPLFSYPYRVARNSLDRLSRMRDPDACHGYKMVYINPLTGGAAIPTMTTAMQLMPKEFKSLSYRSTAGTVFSVVEGSGIVTIEGQDFRYGPKDIFVVPSWCEYSIEAAVDSMIFSYSDRVAQEKLDFFRELRGR